MSDENPIPVSGEEAQSGGQVTGASGRTCQAQDAGKSGRYSFKSEGRRQHMLKLRAEGKMGETGPRPKHGIRALEDRLRRGLTPDTPLALLHAEMKSRYVTDLGGEENCSAMELGVCDRLADLDLVRGLLNAQRDGMKRMSLAKIESYAATLSRSVAGYLQAVKTVGPGRRAKEADQIISVRRFAETTPSATQAEQEGGQ